MPAAFTTDVHTAQLTISLNLAAYALAQLFHGPLADRLGRRRMILGAFMVFAVVSGACALAVTIEMLIAGRILQGVFSSVPSVVIVLIIRELYKEHAAVRVMALYGAALGLAPAIGPLVGGYLHIWFGWSAGFWIIAGLAMIMALCVRSYVPETLTERKPLRFDNAIGAYVGLLRRRDYLAAMAPLALIFGALFAFVTTGPVIFIDLLDVPTERYGLSYLLIVVAYVTGTFISSRLAGRLSARELMNTAILIALAGSALLVTPSLMGHTGVPAILTGMTVFGVGLGIILSSAPIVVLDSAGSLPQGPASALLGSCQLGAAALAGLFSGSFYAGSALSMNLTIAGFVSLGAVAFWGLSRAR